MKDRKKAALAAFLCVGLLASACTAPSAPEPEAFSGPVVLVTMADLRADLVGSLGGEPGWTPALDSLARVADWKVRAVSPSSSPVPAMLSLATGTDPWQHGVLSHLFHERANELPTLAQMMGEAGFATRFFGPATRDLGAFGPYDGFDTATRISEEEALRDHLVSLDPAAATFTWIHLPAVAFPYRDRRDQLPNLPAPTGRDTVDRRELLQYADPSRDLPDDLARDAALLYRHEIAAFDDWLGRQLESLHQSGAFDETMVIFTALHGTEFGEHRQALFAQNLGRESIEVPLLVKLPRTAIRGDLDEGPVEIARLWSTLAELVGGRVLPVHLPSLFRRHSQPALSSLFRHGSANRFSVVSRRGDRTFQLSVEIPYAAPEPDFFAAQLVEAGWKNYPIGTSAVRLRQRLDRRFAATPPWLGSEEPRTTLEEWTTSGTRPVEDKELKDELTKILVQRWGRFSDLSRSPKSEYELRALSATPTEPRT